MRNGLRFSSAGYQKADEFDSRSTRSQNAVHVYAIEVGVVELVKAEVIVDVVGFADPRKCG